MSFDWADYLTLAKELAGRDALLELQEAVARCALSRAYYAAYCLARNHLPNREGHTIPKDASHWYVRNEFEHSTNAARRQIGVYLNRMSIARRRADYDDAFTGVVSEMHYVIVMAEEVVDALHSLAPIPPRQATE